MKWIAWAITEGKGREGNGTRDGMSGLCREKRGGWRIELVSKGPWLGSYEFGIGLSFESIVGFIGERGIPVGRRVRGEVGYGMRSGKDVVLMLGRLHSLIYRCYRRCGMVQECSIFSMDKGDWARFSAPLNFFARLYCSRTDLKVQ